MQAVEASEPSLQRRQGTGSCHSCTDHEHGHDGDDRGIREASEGIGRAEPAGKHGANGEGEDGELKWQSLAPKACKAGKRRQNGQPGRRHHKGAAKGGGASLPRGHANSIGFACFVVGSGDPCVRDRLTMSEAKPGWLAASLRPLLPEGATRLRPGMVVLLLLGWLLSPLCWWNDLIVNLPLAWGVAKAAQWLQPGWFSPGLVVGYWLSNLIGFALMQWGALGLLPSAQAPEDRRSGWVVGIATSTLATLAVVVLVQVGWLPSPVPAP